MLLLIGSGEKMGNQKYVEARVKWAFIVCKTLNALPFLSPLRKVQIIHHRRNQVEKKHHVSSFSSTIAPGCTTLNDITSFQPLSMSSFLHFYNVHCFPPSPPPKKSSEIGLQRDQDGKVCQLHIQNQDLQPRRPTIPWAALKKWPAWRGR